MFAAASLIVSLVAVVNAASAPGRALLWSSHRSGDSALTPPAYRSQTSTYHDVHNLIQNEVSSNVNMDMVVVFCSDQELTNDFFTQRHFSDSIRGSEHAIVMPNVYHDRSTLGAPFCSHIQDSPLMKDKQMLSVDEMLSTLSSTTPLTTKNFFVTLQAPSDTNAASFETLLNKLHEKNALIIGLQEPQRAAPMTKGHYTRLLQTTDTTNYNPAGTEFTIYYQNTYLYLTPDLFTGLMTFLFCSVVLLIGFGCMNQIQGPSQFVHIMPTLGKEG